MQRGKQHCDAAMRDSLTTAPKGSMLILGHAMGLGACGEWQYVVVRDCGDARRVLGRGVEFYAGRAGSLLRMLSHGRETTRR